MKHLKLLICLAPVLLLACNYFGSASKDPRSFLTGTFVNYAKGEYSEAYDTLLVQPMDGGSDAYRIYRNTAFRRIENGRLLKTQRRSESWIAVYDQKTRTMLERKKGKVISIFPDSGMIVVGSREYRKLEKE